MEPPRGAFEDALDWRVMSDGLKLYKTRRAHGTTHSFVSLLIPAKGGLSQGAVHPALALLRPVLVKGRTIFWERFTRL